MNLTRLPVMPMGVIVLLRPRTRVELDTDTSASTTKPTTYKNPLTVHAEQDYRCASTVFECRTHKEYADIIDEGAPDHQLATLFGTKTGIDALAEFVRKTKAFQKTRAMEIP